MPVSLNLGDKNTFRPDDRMIIEMFTSTKNSESCLSPTRAGQISVLLSDIKSVISKGETKFRAGCYIQQLVLEQKPYQKGEVLIEIKNSDHVKNWQFSPINKYHILDQNNQFIDNALMPCLKLQDSILKSETNPEVKEVVMPLMRDIESVPGKLFFTNFSSGESVENKENFYIEMKRVALSRSGKTSEWFNSELVKMKNTQKVSPDILHVYSICNRMVSLPSVTTFYKGDRVYAGGRLKSIEEFSLADRFSKFENAGADCEDTGNLIFFHFREIQRTKFKSEEMQNVSWFFRNYIPFGAITTVQGAELADSKGQKVKIYIGDSNDKKVEYGAHIFCLAIPFPKAFKMMKTKDKSAFRTPDLNWDCESFASQLDITVGEGTGDQHPFIFPFECSTTDKKKQAELREYHKEMREAQKVLMQNRAIGVGTTHKLPNDIKYESSARVNFYRMTGGLLTDMFNETGDEFIVVDQKGKRGVNLNYLLYSNNKIGDYKKETNFQVPYLIPVKRETAEESKYYLSLKRQLPFKTNANRIPEGAAAKFGNGVSSSGASRIESLTSFVNACRRITETRNASGLKKTEVVVSYKSDEFFNLFYKKTDPLSRKIIEEIQNEPKIVDVSADLVRISENLGTIDVYFTVADKVPIKSTAAGLDISFETKNNPYFPLIIKNKDGNTISHLEEKKKFSCNSRFENCAPFL
jgi:hypothetical protein